MVPATRIILNKILIQSYNPLWPQLFEQKAKTLREVFAEKN